MNATAIANAPFIPHGPLIQAVVAKKTPRPEAAHIAHMSMRNFSVALSIFQPQLLQYATLC